MIFSLPSSLELSQVAGLTASAAAVASMLLPRSLPAPFPVLSCLLLQAEVSDVQGLSCNLCSRCTAVWSLCVPQQPFLSHLVPSARPGGPTQRCMLLTSICSMPVPAQDAMPPMKWRGLGA